MNFTTPIKGEGKVGVAPAIQNPDNAQKRATRELVIALWPKRGSSRFYMKYRNIKR